MWYECPGSLLEKIGYVVDEYYGEVSGELLPTDLWAQLILFKGDMTLIGPFGRGGFLLANSLAECLCSALLSSHHVLAWGEGGTC